MIAYASLFAPMNPPKPIDMAPATSSAKPAYMTILVVPSEAKPAVRANGTVIPSDMPMIASDIIRGLSLNFRRISLSLFPNVDDGSEGVWDSRSTATSVVCRLVRSFSGSGGADELSLEMVTSAEFWLSAHLRSLPTLLGVLMDGAGASRGLVSKISLPLSVSKCQAEGTTDFDVGSDWCCFPPGRISGFADLLGRLDSSIMLVTWSPMGPIFTNIPVYRYRSLNHQSKTHSWQREKHRGRNTKSRNTGDLWGSGRISGFVFGYGPISALAIISKPTLPLFPLSFVAF